MYFCIRNIMITKKIQLYERGFLSWYHEWKIQTAQKLGGFLLERIFGTCFVIIVFDR